MNKMKKAETHKRKYKIASEAYEASSESVGRIIAYFGILAIICILAFLVAKYIVRSNIDGVDTPIDTSERL